MTSKDPSQLKKDIAAYSHVYNSLVDTIDSMPRLIFDSGPMHKNACMYGNTTVNIPYVSVMEVGDASHHQEGDVDIHVEEDFTVDVGTDELIDTGHTRINGDRVFVTTSGTIPPGLSLTQLYFVVGATTDRFKLATSPNGSPVDITGAGSGTHDYRSPRRHVDFSASRGCGVRIDTTIAKKFLIAMDVQDLKGGRLHIRPFDVNQALLTDDPTTPYVSTRAGTVAADLMAWNASDYGGSYKTTADGTGLDRYFKVTSAVKYVDVILAGGTGSLLIRQFRVYTYNTNCSPAAWLDYEQGTPGRNVATQAPTTGLWLQNRTVYDFKPGSGSPQGWVCTTSGAPGTWTAMPNL